MVLFMGFRMSGAARRRGVAPRRWKRGRLQFPCQTRLETKVAQLLGKVNPVQSTVVGRGGCGGGGHGCYRNGRIHEGGHRVPPPPRVLHHLLADSRGWIGEEWGNGRDGRHVDAGAGARRGEARPGREGDGSDEGIHRRRRPGPGTGRRRRRRRRSEAACSLKQRWRGHAGDEAKIGQDVAFGYAGVHQSVSRVEQSRLMMRPPRVGSGRGGERRIRTAPSIVLASENTLVGIVVWCEADVAPFMAANARYVVAARVFVHVLFAFRTLLGDLLDHLLRLFRRLRLRSSYSSQVLSAVHYGGLRSQYILGRQTERKRGRGTYGNFMNNAVPRTAGVALELWAVGGVDLVLIRSSRLDTSGNCASP